MVKINSMSSHFSFSGTFLFCLLGTPNGLYLLSPDCHMNLIIAKWAKQIVIILCIAG